MYPRILDQILFEYASNLISSHIRVRAFKAPEIPTHVNMIAEFLKKCNNFALGRNAELASVRNVDGFRRRRLDCCPLQKKRLAREGSDTWRKYRYLANPSRWYSRGLHSPILWKYRDPCTLLLLCCIELDLMWWRVDQENWCLVYAGHMCDLIWCILAAYSEGLLKTDIIIVV